MRSHISQRALRAVVENKPYSHIRCLALPAWPPSPRAARCQCPHRTQRRSLFSFPTIPHAASKSKNPSAYNADHAAAQMMQLVNAIDQNNRPPPPHVLATAFASFIQYRLENPTVLTPVQGKFLRKTFHHLSRHRTRGTEWDLSISQLEDILAVLSQSEWETNARGNVNSLARSVFEKIRSKLEKNSSTSVPNVDTLYSYIVLLSATGSSAEALNAVERFWHSVLAEKGILPWVAVVRGLLKETGKGSTKKQAAVITAVQKKMQQLGIKLGREDYEAMVLAVADDGHWEATKILYENCLHMGLYPTTTSTVAAAHLAIRHGSPRWAGLNILRMRQLRKKPTPEVLDVLLLLAAAEGDGVGSVVKELKRIRSESAKILSHLRISAFNSIMEYMHDNHRFDSVEEYFALAESLGLQPDEHTYMLRVSSRVQTGDVAGAISLFEEIDPNHLTEQRNIALRNKIVAQLCSGKHVDLDDDDMVLAFIDRLLEIDGRLDAGAAKSLCQMLLSRHDVEGVSEFLKPIVSSYGVEEQWQIRGAFLRYINDFSVPVENAWEAYKLFNETFPKTPVPIRTNIMSNFFKRQRSDLGVLVFGHMRQRTDRNYRPTARTYAICLHELAGAADADGVFLVHNMLKLDLEVELTTDILNSLMLAYSECGSPEQAMQFFKDILASKQGPNDDTLELFFRVCEKYHNGVAEATRMVEKLKALGIDINSRVYNGYICALGSHGELERAVDAVAAMESQTGSLPTTFTIGALYNTIPTQMWRDQAESWAKNSYPSLWDELETNIGSETDEDGRRTFNIDRSIYRPQILDTSKYKWAANTNSSRR
ncbi:hypothetical protein FQN50_008922 [Emmonsiellopsis sp. PD_5]|nr:hypothetical protein FQN50_008922 [Emmonsiellopsis sp. PD_5]